MDIQVFVAVLRFRICAVAVCHCRVCLELLLAFAVVVWLLRVGQGNSLANTGSLAASMLKPARFVSFCMTLYNPYAAWYSLLQA